MRWQTVKFYPTTPMNQLNPIFTNDAVFRFVDVDSVHSGQSEARQIIIRHLLNSGVKTIIMIWVNFNLGDPLPDWSHFPSRFSRAQTSEQADAEQDDDTRIFQWDPSVPECHPNEGEADYFYCLSP